MRPPKSSGADFTHANIVEFSLFDQTSEGFDRVLDRDFRIHTSGFKEIEFLETSEVLVDTIYASSQIFGACRRGD
jgi:hypothetical protein